MAAVQGCDRAARVIEQLLTLSEIEAGAAPALRPVDLAEVVRGVVADLAQQAFDKHQAIEVEGVDPALVQGDATLLAVLVRNLVDNAIRYSPAQAAVQVRVHREADRILLQVDDSGPGVGEADRLRMGERFFRVLGCANERGSGLGWSIVRRVAAVHHAQVHVGQSKVLGGLGVQVQWPASAA
jgi:two-component system sensor histidine kinase QseC